MFALNYGLEIMQTLGIKIQTVKAGHTNMFLSPLFRSVFTAVTGAELFLYETDGAEGAARGAGSGAGLFRSTTEAFHGLQLKTSEKAEPEMISRYGEVYATWKTHLEKTLS